MISRYCRNDCTGSQRTDGRRKEVYACCTPVLSGPAHERRRIPIKEIIVTDTIQLQRKPNVQVKGPWLRLWARQLFVHEELSISKLFELNKLLG
jgi:phosphoribosylpyrophosphate synthetase